MQEQQPSSTTSTQAKRWTTRELLAWTTNFLKERSVESPRTLAEMLLSSVFQCERLRLYMEVDREASVEELSTLRALVVRAGRMEPIQYLLGHWTFHGREYEVAPCTLIPRPETELLVDEALRWTRAAIAQGALGGDFRVVDVGSGTGCIAISFVAGARGLFRAVPGSKISGCQPLGGAGVAPSIRRDVKVEGVCADGDADVRAESGGASTRSPSIALRAFACDIVPAAVELAQRNATRHGVDHAIDFRVSDLFSAYAAHEQFDLILSNPPYIADTEWATLDANVRHYEPASALRGGVDGLTVVRELLAQGAQRLRPGALLLMEIGWKQGDAVRTLAETSGAFATVAVLRDGNGNDRILRATRA